MILFLNKFENPKDITFSEGKCAETMKDKTLGEIMLMNQERNKTKTFLENRAALLNYTADDNFCEFYERSQIPDDDIWKVDTPADELRLTLMASFKNGDCDCNQR